MPPVPGPAAELTGPLPHGVGNRDAADALAARTRRTVVVQGTGRAGSLTASLLAAAGVGRVHLLERAPTRLVHAIPGGVCPADEGRPSASPQPTRSRAAAPETDVAAPPFGQRPDLVVLAVDEPVDNECRDALHARAVAHLVVATTPAGGVVGPLVVPGLTSCLGCARPAPPRPRPRLAGTRCAAHRAPSLPDGNVRRGRDHGVAIAALAAGQALAFLDGERPTRRRGHAGAVCTGLAYPPADVVSAS